MMKLPIIAVLLAIACLNLGCAKQMRRIVDPITQECAKKETMGPILRLIFSIFGNPPG